MWGFQTNKVEMEIDSDDGRLAIMAAWELYADYTTQDMRYRIARQLSDMAAPRYAYHP